VLAGHLPHEFAARAHAGLTPPRRTSPASRLFAARSVINLAALRKGARPGSLVLFFLNCSEAIGHRICGAFG
jgi:hypothetical protein